MSPSRRKDNAVFAHEFDFELPEELIAQTPLPERTASRLLALDRETGRIDHGTFTDLKRYLMPGDTLVLNDTRVLPARLHGIKPDTGARVELLLLKQLEGDRWETLAKPAKRMRPGTELVFGEDENGAPLLRAVVLEAGESGLRTVEFRYDGIFQELLDRLGEMPLPPYIRERLDDRERYQTVYARHEGSAAAPTAGLHFTPAFLDELRAGGVRTAFRDAACRPRHVPSDDGRARRRSRHARRVLRDRRGDRRAAQRDAGAGREDRCGRHDVRADAGDGGRQVRPRTDRGVQRLDGHFYLSRIQVSDGRCAADELPSAEVDAGHARERFCGQGRCWRRTAKRSSGNTGSSASATPCSSTRMRSGNVAITYELIKVCKQSGARLGRVHTPHGSSTRRRSCRSARRRPSRR